MINDNREDFLPPVVMPPVRRDPNLSLRRDQTPPGAPRIDDEGRPLSPRALRAYQGGYRFGSVIGTLAALLVVVAAAIIGIIACGFVARAIWHALRIGWSVG